MEPMESPHKGKTGIRRLLIAFGYSCAGLAGFQRRVKRGTHSRVGHGIDHCTMNHAVRVHMLMLSN